MRKVLLFCVVSIFLVACGADEVDKERYDEIDTIDLEDPYDERAVIERAIEEQRTILKPGFIPGHNALQDGFRLANYSTTYNPATEELLHEVTYAHKMSDVSMTFEAEKNAANDRYEETIEHMKDKQSFDDKTGYYGMTEDVNDNEYTYAIKEDDTSYFFNHGWWDDGFFDGPFMNLLGESLRTEEDGAYDYFYDQLAFDVDKLHFPFLHKDVVENMEITIGSLWFTEAGESNTLYLRYDLENNARFNFIVSGMEIPTQSDDLSEIDTVETDNGVSVTTYELESSGTIYYTWEKEDYYYAIVLDKEHREEAELPTDNIYGIIDSSTDDNRSFKHPELFDQHVKEPSLTDVDQAILEKVKEVAEEGDAP